MIVWLPVLSLLYSRRGRPLVNVSLADAVFGTLTSCPAPREVRQADGYRTGWVVDNERCDKIIARRPVGVAVEQVAIGVLEPVRGAAERDGVGIVGQHAKQWRAGGVSPRRSDAGLAGLDEGDAACYSDRRPASRVWRR